MESFIPHNFQFTDEHSALMEAHTLMRLHILIWHSAICQRKHIYRARLLKHFLAECLCLLVLTALLCSKMSHSKFTLHVVSIRHLVFFLDGNIMRIEKAKLWRSLFIIEGRFFFLFFSFFLHKSVNMFLSETHKGAVSPEPKVVGTRDQAHSTLGTPKLRGTTWSHVSTTFGSLNPNLRTQISWPCVLSWKC